MPSIVKPTQVTKIIDMKEKISQIRSKIDHDQNKKPHLLFSGQSRTSKSTLAKYLAKNLGEDIWWIDARDYIPQEDNLNKFQKDLNGAKSYQIAVLDEADFIIPNRGMQSTLTPSKKDYLGVVTKFMENNKNKIFIAITNHPEQLDPMLLERMDEIKFGRLSEEDRKSILNAIIPSHKFDRNQMKKFLELSKCYTSVRLIQLLNESKKANGKKKLSIFTIESIMDTIQANIRDEEI